MRRVFSAFAPILFVGSAIAQPTVNSVLNSASNALPGLPGSSIAQGSIFVAYGSNLGPAQIVNVTAFPLPKTLGGTSAQVTVGGTTVDAIMIYSLNTQIAAILPSTTPLGTGTITVTYNGQPSAPAPITVVANSFGTYSLNETGSGAAVATFADYSVVGPTHPAHPNDAVVLWGTGLGPISGDEAAGPAPGDQPSLPIQVFVGGQSAGLVYRGRSGCCAGLDQVVVTVPASVQGCNVPVVVQIGTEVGNYTSIAVAPAGTNVCSDPVSPIGGDAFGDLISKGTIRYGFIDLSRTSTDLGISLGGASGSTTVDSGSASFSSVTFTPGTLPSQLASTISFGACSVSQFIPQDSLQPIVLPNVKDLDAGPAITITGPSGTRTLSKSTGDVGSYFAQLGNGTPGNYLDAGSYTAAGTGGADVGPFTTTFTLPQPLTWTNESGLTTVNRANGQLVTWTGGDPNGFVEIIGSSSLVREDFSSVSATFICTARVSDQSFTVPSVVLLSLPPSPSNALVPGFLGVFSSSYGNTFTATGIDVGLISLASGGDKGVTYQ